MDSSLEWKLIPVENVVNITIYQMMDKYSLEHLTDY